MTSSPLPTGRVTYRTYVEVMNELERIAKANPERVKRFELPHHSVLGQTIYGLEITHNVNASSGKPVFVMTGLHHAREWPTVELTMEFIYDVLKNDGVDPRFTALLDSVRFIAVPVVNVDGYEMSRTLLIEQKRRNCRVEAGKIPTFAECANPANARFGVDLNRNYGAFWGGSGASVSPTGDSHRGAAPFSEPEIQNMRELLASNQVVVALSNHTPDAKVLRVPSANEEPVPADVVPYDSLAQLLGGDLKWTAGPWPKIYYTASGTMEEQAYYSAGTFAFTFENAPGQRSFHPPYSFVIDQYFGTGAYPGSSSRAGYIRLIEAAANPKSAFGAGSEGAGGRDAHDPQELHAGDFAAAQVGRRERQHARRADQVHAGTELDSRRAEGRGSRDVAREPVHAAEPTRDGVHSRGVEADLHAGRAESDCGGRRCARGDETG